MREFGEDLLHQSFTRVYWRFHAAGQALQQQQLKVGRRARVWEERDTGNFSFASLHAVPPMWTPSSQLCATLTA